MKKQFKTLGMIISIALVIFGILIMCGVFQSSASYPSDAGYGYDSGYAIFGADFYNYVCNNSAEAASAAAAAAYNTVDIINLISGGCGAIIIALGLLGFCFFGMMPTGVFQVQTVVCSVPTQTIPSAPTVEPAVEAATEIAQEPVTKTEKQDSPSETEESSIPV